MTFWVFDCGKPLAEAMSDGVYLIITEEPIYKVDLFDMNKTFTCSEADITAYSGPQLADLDHENRGLWKMSTAANVLVLSGQQKGFPVRTNIIYQENRYGKKVYGILIGTLNTQPQDIQQKILSCVSNDIGYITKDMWYIYEKKGPPSALKQVKTEATESQAGQQKRKFGEDTPKK